MSMVALNDIKIRRDEIIRICESHGGHNVRVFGSVARGESNSQSDLDLLVEFESGRSLIDQVAMVQDLRELLGQKVDVVPDDALNKYIKEQVLKEAVAL
jgi:hypothetical protein